MGFYVAALIVVFGAPVLATWWVDMSTSYEDPWSLWKLASQDLHSTLGWTVPTLVALSVALPPAASYLQPRSLNAAEFSWKRWFAGATGLALAALASVLAAAVTINAVHKPTTAPTAVFVTTLMIGVVIIGLFVGRLVSLPPSVRLAALDQQRKLSEARLDEVVVPHSKGPTSRRLATLLAALVALVASIAVAFFVEERLLAGVTALVTVVGSAAWSGAFGSFAVARPGQWGRVESLMFHSLGAFALGMNALSLSTVTDDPSFLAPAAVGFLVVAISSSWLLRRRRRWGLRFSIRAANERAVEREMAAELDRLDVDIVELACVVDPAWTRPSL